MNQVESSYETFTNEFLIKQLISSAYSGAVILSGLILTCCEMVCEIIFYKTMRKILDFLSFN